MSSTSSTSSTCSLRPLNVSSMPVHAGRTQSDQQHQTPAESMLHEIESISVAPLSTSESLRFEVTVVMKATLERHRALTGMHVPVLMYRSEKQLADFEALHKAFSRAVEMTHLLSRCRFCKAIQSHSVTGDKEIVEAPGSIHLSLEQFINNILGLLVPFQDPSDKRICFGKIQCWHLLTRFLLPAE